MGGSSRVALRGRGGGQDLFPRSAQASRSHNDLRRHALVGQDVSQATVAKYMNRRSGPPSQTWKTFLKNHVAETAATAFFVVPTITFRLLYGFLVLRHERRESVHFAATRTPPPHGPHGS